MKRTKFIIKSARPATLLMGISSVIAGTAMSAIENVARLYPVMLCLLFAITSQLASNFLFVYNDLQNHYGSIDGEELAKRLRRHEDGELYQRVKMLAGATTIFGLTFGVVILSYAGLWTFLLGAMLVIMIYLSVMGPMPLIITPFGPLIYYLICGPIGVLGTFLLQFRDNSFTVLNWGDMAPVMLMGLSIGFPAMVALIAMEYQNYREHLLSHRSSIATEFGRKVTRIIVLLSGFAMWGIFYYMTVSTNYRFPWFDMIMPTISLGINMIIWYKMKRYAPGRKDMSPARLALYNLFALSVVTCILFLTIGKPIDIYLSSY